jgi:hypothetical protein
MLTALFPVDGYIFDTIMLKFKIMYLCNKIKMCELIARHTSIVLAANTGLTMQFCDVRQ